jgi:hypothetical protein
MTTGNDFRELYICLPHCFVIYFFCASGAFASAAGWGGPGYEGDLCSITTRSLLSGNCSSTPTLKRFSAFASDIAFCKALIGSAGSFSRGRLLASIVIPQGPILPDRTGGNWRPGAPGTGSGFAGSNGAIPRPLPGSTVQRAIFNETLIEEARSAPSIVLGSYNISTVAGGDPFRASWNASGAVMRRGDTFRWMLARNSSVLSSASFCRARTSATEADSWPISVSCNWACVTRSGRSLFSFLQWRTLNTTSAVSANATMAAQIKTQLSIVRPQAVRCQGF